MIRDQVAGLGALFTQGPVLLLLFLVVVLLAVLAGIGIGRRQAFREVDEQRAEVLRACEDAAAALVQVPGQRQGSS